MTTARCKSNFRLKKYATYLALTGGLWGAYCVDLEEIDCVITAPNWIKDRANRLGSVSISDKMPFARCRKFLNVRDCYDVKLPISLWNLALDSVTKQPRKLPNFGAIRTNKTFTSYLCNLPRYQDESSNAIAKRYLDANRDKHRGHSLVYLRKRNLMGPKYSAYWVGSANYL